MSRPPKFTTSSFSIADAIENGLSELQELRDEMQSWRDGLEEKLSHTEKYQQVDEACNALDSADTSIEIDDTEAPDIRVEVSLGSKRRMARWLRRDNAVAMLTAARDGLETFVEELRSQVDDEEKEFDGTDQVDSSYAEIEDRAVTIESTIQELDEVISECEGVEFPAMY